MSWRSRFSSIFVTSTFPRICSAVVLLTKAWAGRENSHAGRLALRQKPTSPAQAGDQVTPHLAIESLFVLLHPAWSGGDGHSPWHQNSTRLCRLTARFPR